MEMYCGLVVLSIKQLSDLWRLSRDQHKFSILIGLGSATSLLSLSSHLLNDAMNNCRWWCKLRVLREGQYSACLIPHWHIQAKESFIQWSRGLPPIFDFFPLHCQPVSLACSASSFACWASLAPVISTSKSSTTEACKQLIVLTSCKQVSSIDQKVQRRWSRSWRCSLHSDRVKRQDVVDMYELELSRLHMVLRLLKLTSRVVWRPA